MSGKLSGNTLGLKFMQRGAAAKAAAETERVKKQEALKQEELQTQLEAKKKDYSDDEEDDEESSDDDTTSNSHQAPVASTSKLSDRTQSSITTESSYLAFPILSATYGVASTAGESDTAPLNGRFSFGKAKAKAVKEDPDSDDSDAARRKAKQAKNKDRVTRTYSISGYIKPRAQPSELSIREQKRAREALEDDYVEDGSTAGAQVEREAPQPVKYEEDTKFVDDMMLEARRKRQPNAGPGNRKKRKSEQ